MKILRIILVLSVAVCAFSCSTISVKYDYDPGTNFTNLRTFELLPVPTTEKIDQLNVDRITNAVNAELMAKGLRKTSSNPDFVVAMHVGKQSKISVQDWGYGYGGWGGGLDVYQYEQGTLILDFVNPRTNKLLWRAVATDVVAPENTPEKQTEKINKAVAKILSKYPPVQQ